MVAKPGSVPDFEALRELFKHHIESFDYMVDAGLDTMLGHIKPVEIFDDFTSTKLRNILFFNEKTLLISSTTCVFLVFGFRTFFFWNWCCYC